MLNKKRCWPFAILSWLLIEGCAPQPPDVPACEHLNQRLAQDEQGHLILHPSPTCFKQIGEPECGHCVYIVSGKELFLGEGKEHQLNGVPWSKVRQTSIYLPAKESYAPLATYIINACKKMNCSDDVTRFKVKLDSLNGVADAVRFP